MKKLFNAPSLKTLDSDTAEQQWKTCYEQVSWSQLGNAFLVILIVESDKAVTSSLGWNKSTNNSFLSTFLLLPFLVITLVSEQTFFGL